MKHFEKLENFIKSNENWEEILKPNMKSIYPVENRNWYVLMYNLMDMPDDKEIFDIVCQCRGTVVDKTTGEIICDTDTMIDDQLADHYQHQLMFRFLL